MCDTRLELRGNGGSRIIQLLRSVLKTTFLKTFESNLTDTCQNKITRFSAKLLEFEPRPLSFQSPTAPQPGKKEYSRTLESKSQSSKSTMTPSATISPQSTMDSVSFLNTSRSRQYVRLQKDNSITEVADVWADLTTDLPKPLDGRFIEVKKRLVALENYGNVQASWDRLLIALAERAEKIEKVGNKVGIDSGYVIKSLTWVVHPYCGLFFYWR
jgi:hypothetical protein